MEIISMKRANGRLYAYRAGWFWVWNDEQHAWKESHLMAQKYALNHEADKLLTPEDFLTDPAVFSKQDAAELPKGIVYALERAQPCQNAPIEPVKETAVTPAVVPEDKPTVQDNALAFDFSALGDLSEQATEADRQFDLHYGTAQDEYLISCIYLAKVHELTAKAGRYGGGTWTKWYESKGLSEGSVRTMVKNGDAFKSATVAELKQLPELTRKDLNPIARSGCVEQIVEVAGDSQRVKELLEQLHTTVAQRDAAQKNLDYEISQNDALHEEKGQLLRECEAAKKARADAEDKASAAESERDAAIADVNGLAKENAKLHAEKEQAENRAHKAEDALKHQPITAVVDKEEVQRQAREMAADMTEELKAEKAQLQKEVDTLRKSSAQLERRMKAMANQMDDLGQTDFDTANYFANAVLSLWNSCRGSYSRLTGEDLESTFQYICKALNDIREEAARLCRQPDGYSA